MARFDVYRLADGGLVLDCQNNRFGNIGTRFAIPLMPADYAPPHNSGLNPAFEVDGEHVTMVTQFATTIRAKELQRRVGSLQGESDRIIAAIDVLIGTG